MSRIKECIDEYLKQNNMLQKEFAQIIGVQPNTLSQWMNGKRQPDNDTLVTISRVLKIPVDTLLGSDVIEIREPTEHDVKVALFGGAENVTDEDWEKVKEFVEFLKTYKPKKAHLEENKMINYEKFAIRFRIALRAKELYLQQKEKEKEKEKKHNHYVHFVGAHYVSEGLNGEISSSDISLFVDGRKKPTNKQVDMLANFLRVDYDWLSGNDVPYPDWFNDLPLSIHDKTELGIIQLGEVVGDTTIVYAAAQSEENHPDKYIQTEHEFAAKLEDTPESDAPLI